MAYTKEQVLALINQIIPGYPAIDLIVAQEQLWAESAYNTNARSPVGASGVAQFMPATAAQYGVTNPYDPVQSLNGYGRYMTYLLNMWGGNIRQALASYNGGEGRLKKYGGDISKMPAESRNYVDKIMAAVQKKNRDIARGKYTSHF